MVDVLIGLAALGAVACAGLSLHSVFLWRGKAIARKRTRKTVVVFTVSFLATVGLTATTWIGSAAQNREADRKQAELVEYLRPVADELAKLGFEAPTGTTLSDPGLYHAKDNRNIGEVVVRGKSGKNIVVAFMRYETTDSRVGCLNNGGFLAVNKDSAVLLQATEGCAEQLKYS